MTTVAPPNFKKEYNIENLFADLEQFMKDNLDAFIDKMNLDRPDLELKKISDSAYFFQTMNESTANYDPFIFYGERPGGTDSANSTTAKTYEADVAVIMAIGNEEIYDSGVKLMRYRQILENLFEIGWNSINKRVKLEVVSMAPFPFELTNSSAPYAGIGVTLEINLS